MRWDEIGIFWQDIKVERVAKVKIKREPPEPVWLLPDYLPGLDEARAYQFNLLTDEEIVQAWQAKEPLIWDIEIYPNYLLAGFKSMASGKIALFEARDGCTIDLRKFQWMLRHFTVVGFNDTNFDIPIAAAILAGQTPEQLTESAMDLINFGLGPRDFYKKHKLKAPIVDHIDLLQLTPLAPSLKVCAGRLHAPRMADLPFRPGTWLTPEQIEILRWYWTNDLDNTELLYKKHKPAIELRTLITKEYGTDVRSKSDPQIAEAVIRHEIKRLGGVKHFQKAEIIPGRRFRYVPPDYLRYRSANMQWVLDFIRNQEFVLDEWGGPTMSKELSDLVIPIGEGRYSMGIGGLHSQEKSVVHIAGDEYELTDNDVASYYPGLIIQQRMYPPNIGPVFLQVFKRIYDRRLAAKAAGDKGTAETLKIVLNGTFGKTGERGGHSVMYYPEMMIQVTVTGQLSLLMLIEWLELAGVPVVSANTDGILIKCPKTLTATRDAVIKEWEAATGLTLETTPYKAVYARDVNNYIALYTKPKAERGAPFRMSEWGKAKGAYAFSDDTPPFLKKNPTSEICIAAVVRLLAEGIPIEETIRNATDVRDFLEVRLVRGGAVKDGEYLGKAIRWYYAKGEEAEIIVARNGHSVPRSKGARPCMTLPSSIPDDLDRDYYIARAESILEDFYPREKKAPKKAA